MAVAQIGSLTTLVNATTIEASDFNTNYADIRTAFNNLVTATNQLAGGISINGSLTVISGGFTVTVGVISQDDGPDTTSTVTGSIHTDGGLGIAKALWVGTTSQLVGAVSLDGTLQVDGNTLLGTTTTSTGNPRLEVVNSTGYFQLRLKQAVGSDQRLGLSFEQFATAEEGYTGIGGFASSSVNKVFVGGGISGFNASTEINFYTAANNTTLNGTLAADITGVGTSSTLRARGNVTVDKVLSVDDTTTSTSGITGSIHTDGGLGVAGTLYVAGVATLAGGIALSNNVTRVGSETTDAGSPEDTSVNILHTVTIGANDMGTNGGVRIIARGQVTGTANIKTINLKFGSSTVAVVTFTSGETGSYQIVAYAYNRNSASAQVWWGFNLEGAALQTLDLITTSIDTTSSVDVVITGQTNDAADEITAELLVIELIED